MFENHTLVILKIKFIKKSEKPAYVREIRPIEDFWSILKNENLLHLYTLLYSRENNIRRFLRAIQIFLVNGILQAIPAISTNSPLSTLVPLAFVVILGILKEAIVEV